MKSIDPASIIIIAIIIIGICCLIKFMWSNLRENSDRGDSSKAKSIETNEEEALIRRNGAETAKNYGTNGWGAAQIYSSQAQSIAETARTTYMSITPGGRTNQIEQQVQRIEGYALEAAGFFSELDTKVVKKEKYIGCFAPKEEVDIKRVQSLTPYEDEALVVPSIHTYLTWNQCSSLARNLNYPYFGLALGNKVYDVNLGECRLYNYDKFERPEVELCTDPKRENCFDNDLYTKIDSGECSRDGDSQYDAGYPFDETNKQAKRYALNPYKRMETADNTTGYYDENNTIEYKPRLGGYESIAIYSARTKIENVDEPFVEQLDDPQCSNFADENLGRVDVFKVYPTPGVAALDGRPGPGALPLPHPNRGPNNANCHEHLNPQWRGSWDPWTLTNLTDGAPVEWVDVEYLLKNKNLWVVVGTSGNVIGLLDTEDGVLIDRETGDIVSNNVTVENLDSDTLIGTAMSLGNSLGSALFNPYREFDQTADHRCGIPQVNCFWIDAIKIRSEGSACDQLIHMNDEGGYYGYARRCGDTDPSHGNNPEVRGPLARCSHKQGTPFDNNNKDNPAYRAAGGVVPTRNAPEESPFFFRCPSFLKDELTHYEQTLLLNKTVEMEDLADFNLKPQLPGPTGPAGTPGQKGDPGRRGAAGINGLPGQPGEPGGRGEPGAPGAPGAPGRVGPQGAPGAPGTAAAKGDTGDRGDDGDDGTEGQPGGDGDRGNDGDDGDDGTEGQPGGDGDKGDDGTDGDDGTEGQPGGDGDRGDDGDDGTEGQPGGDGDKGDDGTDGDDGTEGQPGGDGDRGDDGDDGTEGQPGGDGDKGEKGDRGPRGTSGRAGGGLSIDKNGYLGSF